jgi:hypothetical protein
MEEEIPIVEKLSR